MNFLQICVLFHFIYYTFLGPDVSWYYRCLRTTHFQIRLSSRTRIVETHHLEYVHVYIALFATASNGFIPTVGMKYREGKRNWRGVYTNG